MEKQHNYKWKKKSVYETSTRYSPHAKCNGRWKSNLISQKFLGKNLSWGIMIELEFGENLVVYKESFPTKPTSYRGYFYIMGK